MQYLEITIKVVLAVIGWIIALILAVIGWIIAHFFSSKRDFNNKKREIRINYLTEAYRKLERGAMPTSRKFDPADVESAIADIQLLGNPKQVNMAYKFAEKVSHGDGTGLQELLEDLRRELRKELKVSNTDVPKISPFRISEKNNQ